MRHTGAGGGGGGWGGEEAVEADSSLTFECPLRCLARILSSFYCLNFETVHCLNVPFTFGYKLRLRYHIPYVYYARKRTLHLVMLIALAYSVTSVSNITVPFTVGYSLAFVTSYINVLFFYLLCPPSVTSYVNVLSHTFLVR